VAAKAVPNVPEIAKMVEFAHAAGLKLHNEGALKSAADGVSLQIIRLTEAYDGSTMAGIDALIPGQEMFRGKARQMSQAN
jgi:hypothetical protein